MAIKVKPTDTLQEIKQAFAVFDTDGDGSITREELGNVMKSLGEDLTDQELEEMLEHADTNGDGLISCMSFTLHEFQGSTNWCSGRVYRALVLLGCDFWEK
jgi:calmodulin